jgi:predicted tellurium resistance membrane protein TerC
MQKTTITLGSLLVLTIISAAVSNVDNKYTLIGILLLAALKFVGVSFYFMELKKAHTFWKVALLLFLMLFIVLILLLGNN